MPKTNQRVVCKRKYISLESKIQILDRLESGEKVSQVAKCLHLNEATVRTIKKHERRIRDAVTVGSPTSARIRARARPLIMEKMEKMLGVWVSKYSEERIPDSYIIKRKALQIYNQLRENEDCPDSSNFVASTSWLDRFKSRFSIQSVTRRNQNAQVSKEAAANYTKEFQRIIEEGQYTPHQVFNAAETHICWRMMPNEMFTSPIVENGSSGAMSSDRVTLLLCSNASGHCTTMPLLVHRTSCPYALKNVNKNILPVYWTTESQAQLTAKVFKEWFLDSFVPTVKGYCNRNNLEFKALLLLGNAPNYLDIRHPNIEIMFLPPNISSLIQPLEQGIVSTFRTNYMKESFRWVSEKINLESIAAVEAWKQFSMLDCLRIIDSSLKEIKSSALNACWEKLWPNSVLPETNTESAWHGIDAVQVHVKLEKEETFDTEDIADLQAEERETNFAEMTSKIKSENDNPMESYKTTNFTVASIREGINLAEQLEAHFLKIDPLPERSANFVAELRRCLAPYYKLYEKLSNGEEQIDISEFFEHRE